MGNLLKKELRLSLHPAAPVMVLCALLAIIPNYPYSVGQFYVGLGIFFICLQGRENHDISYTMLLPVAKRDVVTGRFAMALTLELCHLVLLIPAVCLGAILTPGGNLAGMDAGLSTFAVAFLQFALFNWVFFTAYYKNVEKVGVSFVKASIAQFILVAVEIVCTYAVPLVRDKLDCVGIQNPVEQGAFFLGSLAIYVLSTALAYGKSVRLFEIQDV